MTTYKNSTVDKLVKLGRCVACGRKLTEEDKGIRCGVCREDERRASPGLRDERRNAGLCVTCGQPASGFEILS